MGDYSSMRWNGRRRRKEEEEKSVKCIWDLPKRNSEKMVFGMLNYILLMENVIEVNKILLSQQMRMSV